jgi:hypothetical protein
MEEKGLMAIRTHNVVMRYLRLRNLPPSGGSGGVDAATMYPGSYNVVIDHCSFSWGTDEVFQTDGVRDFTIQWSIIAEGLSNSTHPEGEHSKGLHFRGENSGNISMHHNLLAHHMDRSPNINTTGIFDMVNNVFYNGGKFWTMVKDVFGEPHVNAINNYYKRGPSSWSADGKKGYEIVFYESSSSLHLKPKIFVRGNIGFHRSTNDLPEELIVEESSRFMLVDSRFTAPPITTVSASEALSLVLGNVGATLPVRDAHDQRIINDVRNGTGRIINDPSDVGGLLVMASGTPPVDTDGDGMPDEWEKQQSLNPNDPADANQDRNGDGYTNIEEYLNSLTPSNSTTPLVPLTPETSPDKDTTPPTVSVSNPKDGSTVSSRVTVSATATDMESGIAGVQFKLDGNILGAEDVTAPFSVPWEASSATPGTYSLSAVARDKAGNEKESSLVLVVVDDQIQQPPLPSSGTIFVTTSNSGDLTNGSQCNDLYVSYGDEDILAYNTVSKCWSIYFEGSNVGVNDKEIDAFHIMPDGSILFSLYASASLPDVGEVANTDIVRFIPTSLGKDTAGSFELYLKGASVGLDTKDENIDAIGVLPDGRLVISTSGNFNVSGVSGKDQDLIAFNAISLGEQTSGSWELYFDGSRVGLSGVDVNGVWINGNGHIYFTAKDPFSVAGITVDIGDILKCTLGSTGINTSCTYEFIWDSIGNGLSPDAKVNGIHLAP